ncbi:hypothetical protein [Solilutibacter pythonis]|uniref:hypothetical protein n=1 Tax=Solilutibacter pythonis TaxID=2483112 RepID=UPI0011C3A9A9|nr:hypothetical protein [Lysobacter pythonis]
MRNNSEAMRRAQDAFHDWKASIALAALEEVLQVEGSPDDAAAYLLKGLIFEFGGEGVQVDLAKAVENYRAASYLIGGLGLIPFLYLARALMKQGVGSYPEAFKYIREASGVRHSPEVDLAFAEYYEVAESKPALAKKYYLRAAAKGRFAGFFGLASVLRKEGHKVQALMVDVVRIFLGPILFILLGRAARANFNSY